MTVVDVPAGGGVTGGVTGGGVTGGGVTVMAPLDSIVTVMPLADTVTVDAVAVPAVGWDILNWLL
jgi:hypothetical protein